ncbi:MAG: LysR family transcriptional regulator [Reyranella sp.]|nr:LysR family transcriptional regulator [Reyranella sp.]
MDYRQVHSFLCLYDEGSVTRAASRLGIVQPALSMLIAKLERDLGVVLFDRSSRGVMPTAEGKRFYELALPLARGFENVRRQMIDMGGAASGTVRVGIVPSLMPAVVPAALQMYCDLLPDVSVQVTEGYSATLLAKVDAGELDFAIVNDPLQPGALAVEPLIREELVLVTSRTSKLAAPGLFDCTELQRLPLIMPTAGQGRLRIPVESRRRRAAPISPRLEMDAIAPTLELVKSGRWATILPLVAIAPELARPGLQVNRLRRPGIKRALALLHHPRRPPSLAAKKLQEALAGALKDTLDRATEIVRSVK